MTERPRARHPRRWLASVGGAIAVLSAVACAGPGTRGAVDAWMSCDECTNQQRQRVEALGRLAVPRLARFLRGPSARRLENKRRQFSESYQLTPGLTHDAYVTLMLDAYVALNQTRAAVSLGDIGTSGARAALALALAEAESRQYRRDVVQAISVAFARASHSAFDGTLSATSVDFGDTVRVRPGSVAWDGNESVELHGSPFGNEVFLRRFDEPANDDSLSFVAVGELGSYALAVTGLGPANAVQVDTTIAIRSMHYAVHTPVTADVITQADLPYTRYLVLGARGGSDTTDYFRVAPISAVSVTATARWPGMGDVHLAWRTCGPGLLGHATVAGRIVFGSQTPVGGAQVRVVTTALSATTSPTGDFLIDGIPAAAAPGGLVTLQFTRLGYAPRVFRVPIGTSGHVLGVTPATATAATALTMTASPVVIDAGGCRLLQVWAPPTGKHRIVQLKIE